MPQEPQLEEPEQIEGDPKPKLPQKGSKPALPVKKKELSDTTVQNTTPTSEASVSEVPSTSTSDVGDAFAVPDFSGKSSITQIGDKQVNLQDTAPDFIQGKKEYAANLKNKIDKGVPLTQDEFFHVKQATGLSDEDATLALTEPAKYQATKSARKREGKKKAVIDYMVSQDEGDKILGVTDNLFGNYDLENPEASTAAFKKLEQTKKRLEATASESMNQFDAAKRNQSNAAKEELKEGSPFMQAYNNLKDWKALQITQQLKNQGVTDVKTIGMAIQRETDEERTNQYWKSHAPVLATGVAAIDAIRALKGQDNDTPLQDYGVENQGANYLKEVLEYDIANKFLADEDNSTDITEYTKTSDTQNKLYEKYPDVRKEKLAGAIGHLRAKELGITKDSEDDAFFARLGYETSGADAKRLAYENGLYETALDRQLVDKIAGEQDINPLMGMFIPGYAAYKKITAPVENFSFAGQAGQAIADVVENTGKSVLDLAQIRSNRDISAESYNEDVMKNWKKDQSSLDNTQKNIALIGNTTGQVVGQALTTLATSSVATGAGLAADIAENAGFWGSGALVSYDGAKKSMLDITNSDVKAESGALLIAFINAASEKIFKDTKVLGDVFGKKVGNIISKIDEDKLFTEATRSELSKAFNSEIPRLVKNFGKETNKEGIEEVLTAIGEDVIQATFGDDKNFDVQETFKKAKDTYVSTLIGGSIAAGAAARTNVKVNPNAATSLYHAAENPSYYISAIKELQNKKQITDVEANKKIQIINTATAINKEVSTLDDSLNDRQKAAYISLRTTQAQMQDMVEKTTDPTVKAKLEANIKMMDEEKDRILNGLQFNENLQPLNNLYDKEQAVRNAERIAEQAPTEENMDALFKAKEEFSKDIINHYTTTAEQKEETPETYSINGKPATKEQVDEIIAKGQKEVDKYDIEYSGSNQELHSQLEGFGATKTEDASVSPKSRETVLDESASELYDRLQEKAPAHFLDPLNKKGSIEELANQALTTPSAIKNEVGEKLFKELVARNSTEEINKSIEKWRTVADKEGESVDPQEKKDAQRHIDLLEKGLEEKGKIHEASAPEIKVEPVQEPSTITDSRVEEIENRRSKAFEEAFKRNNPSNQKKVIPTPKSELEAIDAKYDAEIAALPKQKIKSYTVSSEVEKSVPFSLKRIEHNADKVDAVSNEITKQLDSVSDEVPFNYKITHSGNNNSTYIEISDEGSPNKYIIRISDHDKLSPTRRGHFEMKSPDWNINVINATDLDLSIKRILNKIKSHKEGLSPSSFIGDERLESKGLTEDDFLNNFNNKLKQENKPIASEQDTKAAEVVDTEKKASVADEGTDSGKQKTGEETGESRGGKKPPVDNENLFGEGEEGKNNKKEFDKMTSSIPNSGEVKKYLSGDTIKKYEKDKDGNDVELRNQQEIVTQELDAALRHGLDIIEKAKEIFGDDYVNKTLDYIEANNLSPENKSLLYVSLENEMAKRVHNEPDNAGLKKLQDLVRTKSQAYLRSNSLAINMGRLRKFAETGYDISKVTDRFFTQKENTDRNTVEKLVQADAETIQKQSEEQVQRMEAEGIIPELEKKINEGIEKEINKIYEQLPKEKKSRVDKAIQALEKFQKSYKGKAYDATIGVPLAIIDAGVTTIRLALKAGVEISRAIELGINKIKEKYGKKWENENMFRDDMADFFNKEEKELNPKEFTKTALINSGFGKTIKVKTKEGVQERQVIDWKKLAGEEGSIDKISENVAKSLAPTTYSKEQINAQADVFIKEYNDIRAAVIEKGLNEIAARNKTTVTADQKSAAKKLAEMYNYGLFDKDLVQYENVLAKTIGVDKLNPERLKAVIELGKATAEMLSTDFQGKRLTEQQVRTGIQRIDELMRYTLNAEANAHGSTFLKIADTAQTYMDLTQRMTLNSLKQAAENPLSGRLESLFSSMGYSGTVPKELNADARKMARQLYKEIVLEKGAGYGGVQSTFISKGNLERGIEDMSDSKLIQGIVSTVIGKTTLDAVDSMYKAKITQQKYIYNLINVLSKDRLVDGKIEKGMTKQEAQNYVSEKLTGQSFKEAQATSKEIIDKVNKGAGKKIFNDSQLFIDRLAHDIVNAALINGQKVSAEMVDASYNAAYKAAGRGLGHVANNIISRQVGNLTGGLESRYREAVKEKEYNKAAVLRMTSMMFRNVINPFVGGGSNWVVLKAEKTGLGLLSGVASMAGRGRRMDLTSESGIKNLENAMYEDLKIKDKFIRGAVGGVATALSALAIAGITSDDDYRKWRLKNMWAAKYLDLVTPEIILASMAKDNKKFDKYLENFVNKNEYTDKGLNTLKVIKSVATGDKSASAKTGELLGSVVGAATPWRLIRDADQLWTGLTGGEPYKVSSDKPETFLQGFFKAGMLDYFGFAPHPENHWFTKDELKSISFKILEEKEIEPPKMASIKQIKVDVDKEHPEGFMTEKEYDKFTEDKRGLLKTGIDKILESTYSIEVTSPDGESVSTKEVKGKDLPKQLLKDKIEAVSGAITEHLKKKMNLIGKADKTTSTEIDGTVKEWLEGLEESHLE